MAAYRVAVMADIHGNLPAFEAVMAELDAAGPLDGILVAGDIICGPDQQTILHHLIDRKAVMIQGNNEQAVARIAAGTAPGYLYTARQYALRRWAYDHLTPQEMGLICSLPEQVVWTLPGADAIRMSHGSPRSVNELVIPGGCSIPLERILVMAPDHTPNQLGEILQLVPEPVLVFGHTHLPWHKCQDGRQAFNPGAVCFPEDGFVGAQYALLTWSGDCWTPEFHTVLYDMEAYCRANQESGFLSTGILARIFLQEIRTGKDILPDFFRLARQLMYETGRGDMPYIPDDIWDRATAEFIIPEYG